MPTKKKRRRTTKHPRMWRQGDVIIVEADETAITPSHQEVPRENGGVVLAHGEVTGHTHQLRDPGVCLLRAEGVHDGILRIMDEMASLVHEEHSTIELPRGTYVCRIQREYHPQEIRRVVD